jgi:hypothetical protein
MGAVDRPATTFALLALLGAAMPACAPRAQPQTLPPQTVTQAKPDPPPPSDPPVAAPERQKNETIVIESGAGSAGETTSEGLVAAARAERERRRTAPPPAIVLDNKSLPKYATGQLTIAKHDPEQDGSPSSELDEQAQREKYWRERALAARQKWHDSVEAIATHEKEAAELRTRFYAEDDPYVRDGQVKPAWDRALDLLAEAKRDAAAAEAAVADMMEEGRQQGAWPGWLREGLELEPTPSLAPPSTSVEPGEPNVVQEPPRDPTPP